jgi:hypothetical protein
LLAVIAVGALGCFLSGVSQLQTGRDQEDRQQLENAVRRAAVACYAAEGIYPPDLAYIQEHYGLQVDESRYTVMYDIFGSNLMPDITVLENTP